MEKLEVLPEVIVEHENFGGVVEFSVFEEATDTIECHAKALAELLSLDTKELISTIDPVQLTIDEFHGDWFDPIENRLVKRGSWRYLVDPGTWIRPEKVSVLENPYLTDLPEKGSQGGGFSPPALLGRGQFAYAATQPPYTMRKMPSQARLTAFELEAHYLALVSEIMRDPPNGTILDWACQEIVDLDGEVTWPNCNGPSLQGGMEWWGVFVMTVFCPQRNRITALVASATD